MSTSLASRFVPQAGIIRSWDNKNTSYSQNASRADSVLVIIDDMMNLALLARSASMYTGNASHLEIAISHANKTRDNHFRPDGSTYHVCEYSGTTGEVYLCRTAQGLGDESTWARGQAWAVHGFGEMFGFVKDESYLETAVKAADWFLEHLPEDGVPFWDFDAEYRPDVTPRDSSAAMIAASGMIVLQEEIEKRPAYHTERRRRNYRNAAIKHLDDTIKLSLEGEISYADIKKIQPPHSVQQRIAGDERNFDTGLVYGDYYFIEAGDRLAKYKSSADTSS